MNQNSRTMEETKLFINMHGKLSVGLPCDAVNEPRDPRHYIDGLFKGSDLDVLDILQGNTKGILFANFSTKIGWEVNTD